MPGRMTQAELYDRLLEMGIREPAVAMFGTRCVAGRWEDVSEQLPNGHICRVGRMAVHVLGEGSTWDDAHEAAAKKLHVDITKR